MPPQLAPPPCLCLATTLPQGDSIGVMAQLINKCPKMLLSVSQSPYPPTHPIRTGRTPSTPRIPSPKTSRFPPTNGRTTPSHVPIGRRGWDRLSCTLHYLLQGPVRLQIAIEASATSLSALQRKINSLSQVTLQNRRALDLLTAEKGGTCLFLREECCYYLNESGLVETNIEHLKEIQKTLSTRPGSSDPLTWWQSPLLTWLLPIVTPLVAICIICSYLVFSVSYGNEFMKFPRSHFIRWWSVPIPAFQPQTPHTMASPLHHRKQPDQIRRPLSPIRGWNVRMSLEGDGPLASAPEQTEGKPIIERQHNPRESPERPSRTN
ncbi:uncharacterized protein LOC122204081 [Panthera leo]|uniref:uncharacterized protein LOC122204081 n=1 Tax=Panthera leo TaxID=9689 RepID=UPI001C69991F|nr:uncharacterized protein LOC122204081 [Panthera leo]